MLDETIITETPPLYCCYGRISQQVRVPITGNRSKRVLYGAINVRSGDVLLLITEEWVNETHQAFLSMIRSHWRGWNIVLFEDRAFQHTSPDSRGWAEHLGMIPIGNSGSPALSMKSADFRPGTTENSLEKEDRCAGWRPRIIESAGEPKFRASFDRQRRASLGREPGASVVGALAHAARRATFSRGVDRCNTMWRDGVSPVRSGARTR